MFHWAHDLTDNLAMSVSLTAITKNPFILRMTPSIRRTQLNC